MSKCYRLFTAAIPILQFCIELAALHYIKNRKKSIAQTKDEQIEYCIRLTNFQEVGHTVHEVRDESSFKFMALFPNHVSDAMISF